MTTTSSRRKGGFVKWVVRLVAIALLLIIGFVVWLLNVLTVDMDALAELCQQQSTDSGHSATAVSADGTATQYNSAEQRKHIQTITDIGNERAMGEKGIILGLSVAMQESGLKNLTYGHGSSLGLFQQIAIHGSAEERTDPVWATNKFYDMLEAVEEWREMSYLDAALAAQRPSRAAYLSSENYYPDKVKIAQQIVKGGTTSSSMVGTTSYVLPAELCDIVADIQGEDRLELAVREALSRVGDEHGKRSGRLLRSVFETVDVTLPAKPGKLQAYTGNPMEGVSAKLLDVSEVKAGDVSLQRGDIVLEEMPDGRLRIGLETGGQMPGSGQPGEVRIATFNLRGSGHTGMASARTRMGISVGFIKRHEFGVVGLQELHGPQRPMLRKRLGDGWGIYPRKKEYGAKGASVNSIIWDRSKFTLLEGRKTPMPYYFGGKRKDIPLVKLVDNATGQEFWVANTHDPAKGFALLRVKNAREHHRLMKQLTANGTPMFFTGDFNSGFALRPRGGNTTLGHKYKNLAICIMEAEGVAQNSYNAFKGRSGQCPEESSKDGKVHGNAVDHVYVSSGVVVSDWQIFRGQTGSDHPVVWADANISGVGGPRAPPPEGGLGAVVTVNDGAVSVEVVRKKRLQAVLRLTITAPPSQTAMAGGLWWPLGGGVKAVQNPSIFADGTTSLAGHPYKAHDISVPEGTDVLAMAPGEVTNISNDACNRKYIQVWSEGATVGGQKGVSLNYFHVKPDVEKGDTVAGGQKIATVVPGFSVSNPVGCASPHLHMEATKTGYRPSCSRDIDCSPANQREFLHMGPELFATWEALKNGAASTGTWVLPINPPYTLTASYGQSGAMWVTAHTGQDFSAATGTPVYAVTSGTVRASYHDSYGNLVQLNLADGTVFYYAHLSAFSIRDGDTVQAGQQLGEVGSTGNSSGPHLHFEVRDASNRHFDPMGLLRQHGLNP